MKRFVLVLMAVTAATVCFAEGGNNALTPEERRDGWVLLFDGQSLNGWENHGGGKWSVEDGAIVPGGAPGWISTTSSFSDFILKVELRIQADGNSGIFIRSDPKTELPAETGYEVQVWDFHRSGFTTGSLVYHVKASPTRLKGGEWNSFEITARRSHFTVVVNGQTVLETDDQKSASGVIGMQYGAHKVEFRNLKLKPLN